MGIIKGESVPFLPRTRTTKKEFYDWILKSLHYNTPVKVTYHSDWIIQDAQTAFRRRIQREARDLACDVTVAVCDGKTRGDYDIYINATRRVQA